MKCNVCKKKIPEYMKEVYTCKCNGIYCTKHKVDHECTFDYNLEFRETMKDRMPPIIPRKLEKIY